MSECAGLVAGEPDAASALYMHMGSPKSTDMKNNPLQKASSLNLRSICRCMMEDGYYPIFEKTHIQFGMDRDTAVVEYEDGVLSIRLFFSIEEDAYDLFLEASNMTMLDTFCVKPAVLDDMKNIMFSCEMLCDSVRDFRKFFPRACEMLKESVIAHKAEMKKLILASEVAKSTLPARDGTLPERGRKTLS